MSKTKLKGAWIHYPFCQDLSWKKDDSNQIDINVSNSDLERILDLPVTNVLSDGGLLESWLTCSIFEYCVSKNHTSERRWIGNIKHKRIIELNGLANIVNNEKYKSFVITPSPILSNRVEAFFNLDFNKFEEMDWLGIKIKDQEKHWIEVMQKNMLFKWDNKYIPRMRNLKWDPNLDIWAKNNNLMFNKPFILLIPNMNISSDKTHYLSWKFPKIKSFTGRMNKKGVHVIVLSDDPGQYHSGIKSLPFTLDNFFNLVPKAMGMLADEIDFLALATVYSKCKICLKSKNLDELILYHDIFKRKRIYARKKFQPHSIAYQFTK